MKILKILSVCAICALMTPVMSSCGDDEPSSSNNQKPGDDDDDDDGDDDDGNGGNGGNGGDVMGANNPVINFNGNLLVAVGDADFDYDNQYRLSEVYTDYEYAKINYNRGTIDWDGDLVNVSFTREGYIASISYSWNSTESYGSEVYQYSGSSTSTFTYNNGYLTSTTSDANDTSKNLTTGESSTYQERYTINFTWSQGNLTKAVDHGYSTMDGDANEWTYNYNISYSNRNNAFRQWPITLFGLILENDPFPYFASVGYFGFGPSKLPTLMVEQETAGEEVEISIWFDLNANGSIGTEGNYYHDEYDEYEYEYEPFGRSMRTKSLYNHQKKSLRHLFVNHRNHRSAKKNAK